MGKVTEENTQRNIRRWMTFYAMRGTNVVGEIRRYLDCNADDLRYSVSEYGGLVWVDYRLTLEGPEESVDRHLRNIWKWLCA